jgi:probable HAF family extracellular repeat protein
VASVGSGVSGDGNVVTGYSFDADFNTTAFRWTSGGGMQSIGTLPGGTSSEGRKVSRDGSTIIGIAGTPQGDRAIAWTESGGMQSLGLLSPGDSGSSAWGVNANGTVGARYRSMQIGGVTAVPAYGLDPSAGANAPVINGQFALVNTALPQITGAIVAGTPVPTDGGVWVGAPTIAYAYEWQVSSDMTEWAAASGAGDPGAPRPPSRRPTSSGDGRSQ